MLLERNLDTNFGGFFMKKSALFISTLAALTLAMGALAVFNDKALFQANATEQKTLIVNDNFNDSNYEGEFDSHKWTTPDETPSIKQSIVEDTYFYNNGDYNLCTEVMFYGTREVKTFEYIQFDICFFSSNSEWLSFKFYKDPVTVGDISSKARAYEGPIGLRPNHLGSLGETRPEYGGHPFFANIVGKPDDYVGDTLEWAIGEADSRNKWITVRIEPISPSQVNFFVFNKEDGKNDEKAVTFDLNADGLEVYNYQTCQFGFQCANNCSYALDNFEFKEAGVADPFIEKYVAYHDDDVAYPLGYVRTSSARYEITGASTLDVYDGAHAGDRLIAVTQLRKDETVAQDVSVIDARFQAKFLDAATDDESFGFVFGLPQSDGILTSAGGVLELRKNKAILRVYDGGAQISDDAANTVTFGATIIDQLTTGSGLNLAIRLTKSGIFSLLRMKDDGSYVVMKNFPAGESITQYHGYAGFMALSDITHNISLDDVVVYNCQYYVPVTKSVTHNFSNNFFGNSGYEDFYIPSGMDGKIEVRDGKLAYTACSDNAFFGSAHQYDAFVLDYKLCSVLVGPEDNSKEYTSPQKWIGLDLSRRVPTLTYYGSYATLLFEIHPRETSEYEYLQLFTNTGSPLDRDVSIFTYREKIPCSMFRKLHYTSTGSPADIKEEDYVCVRWVSDGNSISLYLKTNSETEYTLYGTFSNVELNGYFALCNTGFTFLEYDDFSMANTSPIYTCADNEVPETITETEVITNYDTPNVDVNLQDEIKFNASGLETVFMITTIVLGVCTVGLAAGLVVVIVVKKKKAK